MNIKRILFIIFALVFPLTKASFGQVPQSFNYQAVARDASGSVIVNQVVSFRISLLQGSAAGTSVYTETHTVTTNLLGLVNFAIGGGIVVSGNFSTINWATGPYFVQIELDVSNSGSYLIMGTSQLLSVPYAQYAEKSGNPTIYAGSGIQLQNDSIVNIGDLSSQNEIQFFSILNDSLKLSQTNGGIPLNNFSSQIPSGGYLETNSSIAPSGYSFTGKIEAENCKQLIKLNTFVDTSFQDTLNFNSVAGSYVYINLGDDIYAASCYMSGSQVVKKFIRYNIPTNTWSTLPSFSRERTSFSMISLNNKIYIIGGDSNLTQFNNHFPVSYVEEYDISTNSWILKANMPTSRFFAIPNIIDNKVYIIGGATSFSSQWNYVFNNEVFDPSTNTWSQKAPIPTSFNAFYKGTVSNTSIYLRCYTDINQTILKVISYNILSDAWTTIQIPSNDFDSNPYGYSGGLDYLNDKLFSVFASQSLSTIFEYDSISHSWNKKFDSEYIIEHLLSEPELSITVGFNPTNQTRICSVYSTENGTLLCKSFLTSSPVANLRGNGCIFLVVNNGTNKIGLYKYEFPSIVYKYIKN
jgi:hypothetical protein